MNRKLYDASPEWLKEHGLTARDAQRLFGALATLADYEGPIKDALDAGGNYRDDHAHVCHALRYLVDGEE